MKHFLVLLAKRRTVAVRHGELLVVGTFLPPVARETMTMRRHFSGFSAIQAVVNLSRPMHTAVTSLTEWQLTRPVLCLRAFPQTKN